VKAYGVQARTASHPAAENEEESNNNEGLALERDSLEEIVRYTETLHHHYLHHTSGASIESSIINSGDDDQDQQSKECYYLLQWSEGHNFKSRLVHETDIQNEFL